MQDFDKKVNKWKNMIRSEKANNFYDEEIFPTVIERFVDKYRPKKQYDGLILTVGFSPQPLILSIRAINPKRIALLYTPEAKDFVERIQAQTGHSVELTDQLQIDGTDVRDIYD